MKMYRLLMLLLCVHWFALGMNQHKKAMSCEDICKKINDFYNLIDNNGDIISKLNQNTTSFNYLVNSGDYNNIVRSKYIELFNDTSLPMLQLPNKINVKLSLDSTENKLLNPLDERALSLLLHNFINFMYKKIAHQDHPEERNKDKITSELFDDLIDLRLKCAHCLDKSVKVKNKILKFKPLALSRWNPFGWGNWYDRLHRTINSLPSIPWDEWNTRDTNRALVRVHLQDIQNNMGNYGKSVKPFMQLYVCIMRELRILIRTRLDDEGRSRLRYLGAAGAALVGVGALKYWFGGKKAGDNVPPTTNTKKKGFGSYQINNK